MKTSQIQNTLIALAGTFALLVGYYWVHKPIDILFVLVFGGTLLDVMTVLIIALIGTGLGMRVLAGVDLKVLSSSERMALYGASGLGMLALPVLVIGLAGLLNPLVLWALVIMMGLVLRQHIASAFREFSGLARRTWRGTSGWPRLMVVFTLGMLVLALLRSLAPSYTWDALMYHLVGPQRYLEAGRIMPAADNFYLGFPQSAEMLYTLAMGLFGRDTAAAPVHLVFGVLAILSTAGLARRYAGELAGILSAAILLSAYSLWLLAGQPYVDLAVMAYGACALSLFTVWREDHSRQWLVLMGMTAGFALSIKYPAGNLLIALGVGVFFTAPRRSLPNLAILGLTTILVFSPWLLRGLILYGNPVYPFVFDGLNWSPYRTALFSGRGMGLLSTPYTWHLPVLPLAATIFGLDKASLYSFTSGPWLLAAPLLLLPAWRYVEGRARSLVRSSVILIAPLLTYWVLVAALTEPGIQTRLMTAVLPAFAALGAIALAAFERWPRKPFDLRFVLRAIFGFTLLLGTIDTVRETVRLDVLGVLMGSTPRSEYLFSKDEVYINAMRRLQELPDGTQVRFLWEPRAYYCPQPLTCTADVLSDHWSEPVVRGDTPESIFAMWRDSGDAYVLVRWTGYDFYLADARFAGDITGFREALETHMQEIWADEAGVYALYTWNP